MMAGVFRAPPGLAVCDERWNLQPNQLHHRHNCQDERAKAKAERIVGLRSSRQRFENIPQRQFLENCDFFKRFKKNSALRHRINSGRVGGYCGFFTPQDVMYRSGQFVRENPFRLRRDLRLRASSSSRGSSTVCRVQSVEGTGSSYGRNANPEQRKFELSTERGEESGEIPEVSPQEGERVDSAASAETTAEETDGKAYSGNPRNNGSSVVSSHEESGEASSDVEKGTVPQEELQDYGTGTDWEEEVENVTRISVPRQRYIPVPKVDLVNALLLLFFPANKDASKFLSICSYLEIILHAEHKVLLEELRSDYSLTHSLQDGSQLSTTRAATNSTKLGTASTERAQKHETVGEQADWPVDSLDMEDGSFKGGNQPLKVLTDLKANLKEKFMTALKPQRSRYDGNAGNGEEEDSSTPTSGVELSEAAAERFQKNFVRILRRAEFDGISLRDLELTAALNSDYLLATPVDVDWKRTSTANVKIFRRGYTKEEQKGLLLGAKFDYLQSVVLRQSLRGFTGPLLYAGRWCIEKWNSLWDGKEGRGLAESLSGWLQEPLQLENEEPVSANEQSADHEAVRYDRETHLDMPIWLVPRQAIPRYEAILTSAGSRGLLIRRILVRMGLLKQSETPSQTRPISEESVLEPHLRPNHLSRVSMKDIWLPTSTAVVGRNVWKRISAAFSVFFSQATLQEPAYKEVVLLYNMDDEGAAVEAGLQLQTYRRIPLPDLKIVFPSKKLRFRVLDTLRLDITSIVGLLAFTVNYRFDDFLSSPSAFVLDIIAVSALVVFATRVAFGYKQVWDRYQLLVNKTLYEKTGAKGFGVVQFLLDESEEQQFKETVLVFTVLVSEGKADGMTTKQLVDSCERILYSRCKQQVEMPVDSAVSTLLKFGLIDSIDEESAANPQGEVRFRALSYEQGYKVLEQHWVSMPSMTELWN